MVTCMKQSLNAMFNQESSDVVANLNREQSISFIQDIVHLATKLRNRLLKYSILLPMGSKLVSVSHLKMLINNVKKEIHGLVKSDICPDDRQNFDSFVKVSSDRILDALKMYVVDSEGTVTYLKISRDITEAFTKLDLSPLERVYKIWHALYFFRAWKKWILYQKCSVSQLRAYENFISENAFTCLELNAYGLLHLITKFRTSEQSHLFLVALFNSQHCERTFRSFRSMTTANWTKINFKLLELLHMASRIELQNEIAYFRLKNLVKLPRIHNQLEKHVMFDLPSDEQLQNVLEQALDGAIKTAAELNMIVTHEDIRFCQLKKSIKSIKGFGANVQKKMPEQAHSSLDPSNTNLVDKIDCTYFRKYSDVGEIDGNSRFLEVVDEDGSSTVIKKTAMLWRASKSKQNLSNDRLKRVQGIKNTTNTSTKRKNTQQPDDAPKRVKLNGIFNVLDKIQIGQWCIFKKPDSTANIRIENEYHKELVIGVIVGFKYIGGKNQTDKQYSLDIAPVFYDSPNKRGVEVLALWYEFKDDFTLQLSAKPSFFINIDCYVANTASIIQNATKTSYKLNGNIDQLKKDLFQLMN